MNHTTYNRFQRTALALVAACTLLTTICLPIGSAVSADYPSWDDVLKAKANTEKAAAKANEIKGHIAALQAQADQAQAFANERGAQLQVAEDQLFEATLRATAVLDQAAKSQAEANAASQQAGRMTAQMYRSAGSDLNLGMLFEEADAKELLGKLGNMSKLAERSNGVFVTASQMQNTAQSLGKQATIAQEEREKLKGLAEANMQQAVDAAQKAQATVDHMRAQTLELEAQLGALQSTETSTIDEYRRGVEAAREAERQRDNGGSSEPSGPSSDQGWVVPARGPITDVFGKRPVICTDGGCSSPYHSGTDIGARCDAPIYAASAGTVTTAGWWGTYGNFVLINHGDGVSTGYAHSSKILTRVGARVSAGEVIAKVGTTGASDGCHLHFEVRIDGERTDPQPFMRRRGAPLG